MGRKRYSLFSEMVFEAVTFDDLKTIKKKSPTKNTTDGDKPVDISTVSGLKSAQYADKSVLISAASMSNPDPGELSFKTTNAANKKSSQDNGTCISDKSNGVHALGTANGTHVSDHQFSVVNNLSPSKDSSHSSLTKPAQTPQLPKLAEVSRNFEFNHDAQPFVSSAQRSTTFLPSDFPELTPISSPSKCLKTSRSPTLANVVNNSLHTTKSPIPLQADDFPALVQTTDTLKISQAASVPTFAQITKINMSTPVVEDVKSTEFTTNFEPEPIDNFVQFTNYLRPDQIDESAQLTDYLRPEPINSAEPIQLIQNSKSSLKAKLAVLTQLLSKSSSDPEISASVNQEINASCDEEISASCDEEINVPKPNAKPRVRFSESPTIVYYEVEAHYSESIEDEASTSDSNLSQEPVPDKVEEEEIETLDPEIKKILQRGIVPRYVKNLETEDPELRENALSNLFEILHGSDHQKLAVIEAGAIPHFLDCIDIENLISTNFALSNLKILCDIDPAICRQIMDTNIDQKLLELTLDQHFCASMLTSIHWLMSCLLLRFSDYLRQIDPTISAERFNNFMDVTMQLIEVDDEEILVNAIKAICQFAWIKQEHYSMYGLSNKKIERLVSLFDNENMDLKFWLCNFFGSALYIVNTQIHVSVKIGLIHKLLSCLNFIDEEKVIRSALKCLDVINCECSKGAYWLHKAGTVYKVLPILSSFNEEVQKLATKLLANMTNEADDRLAASLMDSASFWQLFYKMKKFGFFDDAFYQQERFEKLAN